MQGLRVKCKAPSRTVCFYFQMEVDQITGDDADAPAGPFLRGCIRHVGIRKHVVYLASLEIMDLPETQASSLKNRVPNLTTCNSSFRRSHVPKKCWG